MGKNADKGKDGSRRCLQALEVMCAHPEGEKPTSHTHSVSGEHEKWEAHYLEAIRCGKPQEVHIPQPSNPNVQVSLSGNNGYPKDLSKRIFILRQFSFKRP